MLELARIVVLLLVGTCVQAALPAPRDQPYPGTMRLHVDVSDIRQRVLRVRETLPVQPGELTLLYPQWVPGHHAPRGPLDQLAFLTITANGAQLPWRRDPLEVYAFRVHIPEGVREIDIRFEIASPQASEQGRVIMNSQLLGLQWNHVVLYPAGYYSSAIPVAAQLQLPKGWDYATGLPTRSRQDAMVTFETASLEVLVDSPVFAGLHGARFELDPGAKVPVRLNAFAESPARLEVKPERLALHSALVRESYAALGPPPFEHYDFLLALSETFGAIGLEHHRSTEISERPGYFTDPDDDIGGRDTMAHELVHAWNGKHRRPRELWTPSFSVPMQDDGLWIYEGMTQYYGWLLSARAGLWKPEFARSALAYFAAIYDRRREGRAWRSLADTTYQPIISPRRPQAFVSRQRTEDYYGEGALIWLDVDTRIRELTSDQRSLDDFARRFLAAPPDRGIVSTYTFDDVVAALQATAPFDWASFLRAQVDAIQPQAPLDGFARSGWKLVYIDKPSDYSKDLDKERKTTDFAHSLGVTVNKDANLIDVVWGSPAFKSGLTINMQLVAVNGRAYTGELLKDALTAKQPFDLLVKKLDEYRTVRIDYQGGLVYPHLERIEGGKDRLSAMLSPRGGVAELRPAR